MVCGRGVLGLGMFGREGEKAAVFSSRSLRADSHQKSDRSQLSWSTTYIHLVHVAE